MGVFSSPIAAGVAKVALAVVSLGGLTTGAYFAYQATRGDGGSAAGQIQDGPPLSGDIDLPTGDRRIAFLTRPADPRSATDILPTQLVEDSGGVVVDSMEALASFDEEALVLDASSVDLPTDQFLKDAYDSGIVLVLIGASGDDLKARIGTDEWLSPLAEREHDPGSPLADVPYATILWRTPAGDDTNQHSVGQHHIDLDAVDGELLLSFVKLRIDEAQGLRSAS